MAQCCKPRFTPIEVERIRRLVYETFSVCVGRCEYIPLKNGERNSVLRQNVQYLSAKTMSPKEANVFNRHPFPELYVQSPTMAFLQFCNYFVYAVHYCELRLYHKAEYICEHSVKEIIQHVKDELPYYDEVMLPPSQMEFFDSISYLKNVIIDVDIDYGYIQYSLFGEEICSFSIDSILQAHKILMRAFIDGNQHQSDIVIEATEIHTLEELPIDVHFQECQVLIEPGLNGYSESIIENRARTYVCATINTDDIWVDEPPPTSTNYFEEQVAIQCECEEVGDVVSIMAPLVEIELENSGSSPYVSTKSTREDHYYSHYSGKFISEIDCKSLTKFRYESLPTELTSMLSCILFLMIRTYINTNLSMVLNRQLIPMLVPPLGRGLERQFQPP